MSYSYFCYILLLLKQKYLYLYSIIFEHDVKQYTNKVIIETFLLLIIIIRQSYLSLHFPTPPPLRTPSPTLHFTPSLARSGSPDYWLGLAEALPKPFHCLLIFWDWPCLYFAVAICLALAIFVFWIIDLDRFVDYFFPNLICIVCPDQYYLDCFLTMCLFDVYVLSPPCHFMTIINFRLIAVDYFPIFHHNLLLFVHSLTTAVC